MNDAETCKAEFRFEKKDLPAIAEALQIPPTFKMDQGSVVDGMEGLCMLLRRLVNPCRCGDMVARFGRPVPVISMTSCQYGCESTRTALYSSIYKAFTSQKI